MSNDLITHARDANGLVRASETVLSASEGVITPIPQFYILNHYDAPTPVQETSLCLRIDGAVRKPYAMSYADLKELPSRTQTALIECAGSSRKFLQPQTPGVQLGNGSVSCGEWTGVALASLISRAGPTGDVVEVAIEGRDSGTAQPENVEAFFAKSLPLEKALSPETIIAWALNGQPLDHSHGSPIRLVVPGWYGVWWVKWIKRIEVLATRFEGFWQKRRYIYDWQDGRKESLVTTQRVKSVITKPHSEQTIKPGHQMIRGYAWSGSGSIARVEVSVDGGQSWSAASLCGPRERWSWTRWEIEWVASPGEHRLCARATDEVGQSQPLQPEWNRLGYGNNAVQLLPVMVA